ncbi:MAG: SDR family oxidoreductase [Deltaproteobacteria bacterium]|jgi:NAD(P)-dependent dehydrogenase (short-subunit alcohol dehydrogenase family)
MRGFRKKCVVVTGGASGIGLAVSRRFAQAGARMALLDADADGLRAAEKALLASGHDAWGFPCDVSQENQCTAAMEAILDRYEGIDVLVNNAGITQRGAFVDTRTEVFERVMQVNFFGTLYCTKAAINSLIQRQGMIIVNESIAALTPLLGRTGYSASKHALHGLFSSLRSELHGTGVHVMIVCPGFVRTNLQTRALGCDGEITTHPQSSVGTHQTPDQVAEAIYQGALKQKRLLVLTPVGKASYWVHRFFPGIYEQIMRRQLRDELT